MKKIKWATVQSLTGGMAIAAYQVFKKPPEFIITSEFGASNTQECINYFNTTLGLNVPIINMDAKYEYFMTDKDKNLFKKLNKDIDVVNYVPICSGLSNLTTSCNKSRIENTQNDNQYQLTNMILEKIKPKVAVYENAPNLYSNSGKDVLEKVKGIAKDSNYSLTIERVDTHNHGIPQHRQRAFVYFWNKPHASLLEYEKLSTPDLIDYLKQVPVDAIGYHEFYDSKDSHKDVGYEFCESLRLKDESISDMMTRWKYNEKYATSTWSFINRFVGFSKAVAWAEKQDLSVKKYEKFLKDMKRLKEKTDDGLRFFDMSCWIGTPHKHVNAVIWKTMGQLPHPVEDRPINLREYAHLMGLPHDFELSNWKDGKMISQNVPVSTAKHVAKQCELYSQDKLQESFYWFIKQNNVKQCVDYTERNKIEMEEW